MNSTSSPSVPTGIDAAAVRHRRIRRFVTLPLIAGVAASSAILPRVAWAEDDAAAAGMREIGQMPAPGEVGEASGQIIDQGPAAVLVDPEHNLALAGTEGDGSWADADNNEGSKKGVALYDLASMTIIDRQFISSKPGRPEEQWSSVRDAALDSKRERLYYLPSDEANLKTTQPCTALPMLRYGIGPDQRRRLVYDETHAVCDPAPGGQDFVKRHGSGTQANLTYHPESDSLYLIEHVFRTAAYNKDTINKNLFPAVHGGHFDPLDDRRLIIDWRLDWRGPTGCGSLTPPAEENFELLENARPYIQRVKDALIFYCYDPRVLETQTFTDLVSARGHSNPGFLVRIPLEWDPVKKIWWPASIVDPISGERSPRVVDPVTGSIVNYEFIKVPALAGFVTPVADPIAGKVFLATDSSLYGKSVWEFNVKLGRFIGVLTGGFTDQPGGNVAVGIDTHHGRLYLLTNRGILVVPTRVNPMPGGRLFPVASNYPANKSDYVKRSRTIAVAPKLGRLVIARIPQGGGSKTGDYLKYLVVQDDTAPPSPPSFDDPDRLTTQIDEAEGKTEVSARGQALAMGGHLIVVGGLARTANQADPACRVPEAGISLYDEAQMGGCAASQLVTPGYREMFMARSGVEVASGSGASAFANGVQPGSADTSTDADQQKVGGCFLGAFQYITQNQAGGSGADDDPNNAYAQWANGCDEFYDNLTARQTDPDTGERSEDPAADPNDPRRRLPDPRAGTRGRDEGGFPVHRAECVDFSESATGDDKNDGPLAISTTNCDMKRTAAVATSAAGGFLVGEPADPVIAVARTSSTARTVRTKMGQVTVALATASGVQLGPVRIAEVRALAVTKAKGRSGTAGAWVVRQWCGIHLPPTDEAAADEAVAHPGTRPVAPNGCIAPDRAENRALVALINRLLQGKIEITVPASSASASKGGYQAEATKEALTRQSDRVVNDDNSPAVAGLEAVFFNDGWEGRNRYVVRLANVHTESRYGITELFSYDFPPVDLEPLPTESAPPPDVSLPPMAGTNGETGTNGENGPVDGDDGFWEEEARVDPEPLVALGPRPQSLPGRILALPLQGLRDVINLLVNNPREFALLFVMWSLLAGPLYMGLRRRALLRTVVVVA